MESEKGINKVPCKNCLIYPICMNKKLGELLSKCPILKEYMEKGLDNFDEGINFLFTQEQRKERIKNEKSEE